MYRTRTFPIVAPLTVVNQTFHAFSTSAVKLWYREFDVRQSLRGVSGCAVEGV
jgi:hypothetical protein